MNSSVVSIGEDLIWVGLKFGIPYKHTTIKKKKKKSGGPFILGAQQCLATKPVCYIRMAL